MGEGDGGGGGWRMKGKRGYSLLCSWMTNFVFYRSVVVVVPVIFSVYHKF